MITIHATKKLLAKLPVGEHGYLPTAPDRAYLDQNELRGPSPSLLGSWHANLLTLQRRNCILLVHDETRFPLFIPALKKPDFANLDWWFEDTLMNALLKCGASHEQIQTATQHTQRLQIDTVCDRSVQGTMSRMAMEVEHHLYYKEVNVADITGYRMSAWLADRPCTVKGRKGCTWPIKDFLALIDRVSEPITERPLVSTQSLPENVIELAAFRRSKVGSD